jgi:hypothetical protein
MTLPGNDHFCGDRNSLAQVAEKRMHSPGTPLWLDDAWHLLHVPVEPYNHIRLHSAIDYITPKHMLGRRQQEIHAEPDLKLAEAR